MNCRSSASPRARVFQTNDEDEPDAIRVDGMVRFCADLGVDPSDPLMLVLSWHLGAATACVYTRAEFFTGMEKMELV